MSTVGDTRSISWCHYLWLGIGYVYTARIGALYYIFLWSSGLLRRLRLTCVCVCVQDVHHVFGLNFLKINNRFFFFSFYFIFSFDFRHVDQSAEPLREILDVSLISLRLRSLMYRRTRTRLPAEWNTSTHRYNLTFFFAGERKWNGWSKTRWSVSDHWAQPLHHPLFCKNLKSNTVSKLKLLVRRNWMFRADLSPPPIWISFSQVNSNWIVVYRKCCSLSI